MILPLSEYSDRIDAAMRRIAKRMWNGIRGADVLVGELAPEGVANKLVVRAGGVQTKMEVTPVIRGCVYEPVRMAVSSTVEDAFGHVEAQVVSFDDIFAGKMTARRSSKPWEPFGSR